jgi:hypothetical protein
MAYITHVCGSTGRIQRSTREQVLPADLERAQCWLKAALWSCTPVPLPGASQLTGRAVSEHGGLLVSVYREPTHPIGKILVAARSRHAALWPGEAAFPSHILVSKPREPWCVIVPAMVDREIASPDVIVHEVERAIAWAWFSPLDRSGEHAGKRIGTKTARRLR